MTKQEKFAQLIPIAKELEIDEITVSGYGRTDHITGHFIENNFVDMTYGEYDGNGNYKITFLVR